MNVNELRLWNHVFDDDNQIVKVENILSDKCVDWNDQEYSVLFSKNNEIDNMYYSKTNPIPLSEKLLSELGFTQLNGSYWERDGIGFVIGYAVDGTFVACNSFGARHCYFYYVHQLQNIWYAVTGTELYLF